MSLARIGCVVLAVAALCGCATVTPPSAERTLIGSRPAPIAEEDWPRRSPTVFPLTSPTVGRTQSELIDRAVTFFIPQDDWRAWQRSMDAGASMRRVGMVGKGHLSEVVLPRSEDGVPASDVEWTRLLMFFSSSDDEDLPYVPSRRGASPTGGPALESSLTTMRVFEPRGEARGVLVHLTGIRGMDSEMELARAFVSRGWVVLSIPPPSKVVERDSVGHWTERAFEHEEGVGAAGKHFARMTDWALAEWAYAAEAGVQHLRATRPGLAGLPLAGIGCSLGALALPATVARLHEQFSAAVLVAGGGPLMRILREGDATAAAMVVRWNDRAFTGPEWEELIAATREASRLDPVKAAEFLRVIPVLQLHASLDGIIPAGAGDELYEALGRPERWSYPVGHVGMFVVLPFVVGNVADWVDRHVGVGGATEVRGEGVEGGAARAGV